MSYSHPNRYLGRYLSSYCPRYPPRYPRLHIPAFIPLLMWTVAYLCVVFNSLSIGRFF